MHSGDLLGVELDGDQAGLELPHLLAASPWSGALFVAGTVLVSLFGAIRVSRAQAQEGMAGSLPCSLVVVCCRG